MKLRIINCELRMQLANTPVESSSFEIRNSKFGFTLIEVILAIGISAIVILTITAVFYAALHLRDATQDFVDSTTPVNQTMTFLRRDLESVVPPTNGTAKVLSGDFKVGNITALGIGQPVAVEMFTAIGDLSDSKPWGDIQRVTYELRDPTTKDSTGKDLVRSVTRNLLSISTPDVQDQWMMSGVQSISFSCFDGTQWWNTWDTTGVMSSNTNLPTAVKVDIQLVGNNLAPIEIVVPIDSQSRSNATTTATSNTGS